MNMKSGNNRLYQKGLTECRLCHIRIPEGGDYGFTRKGGAYVIRKRWKIIKICQYFNDYDIMYLFAWLVETRMVEILTIEGNLPILARFMPSKCGCETKEAMGICFRKSMR